MMLKPLLLERKTKSKDHEIGISWSASRARHSVRNFRRRGDETKQQGVPSLLKQTVILIYISQGPKSTLLKD